MPQMQFDFDGLIELLARHLYSEKKVFIRELIQNAHDAVRRRMAVDSDGYGGRIDIDTRPAELQITFRDNGIGMSREDLEDYLSSIGKSFTRLEKGSVEGLIGQFGIGFLAAFVVARRVEVRTRRFGQAEGWQWKNDGSKDYSIEPCSVDAPGTTVTVFLKGEEDKGVIHQDEVQKAIRKYADMLMVPIHLNGEGPVNTRQMPWEIPGLSEAQRKVECFIYLERTMRDSVLEAIPVRLRGDVHADGVLYLTRSRAIGVEVPRTVRVFLNRMFLCENVSEVLPKWASFVNGVLNTPDLTPTAARDNFVRDEAATRLRDALGDLVIAHLDALHAEDPLRFSQILRFHELGIKSACHYYDPFFAKFAHLLEWRTNGVEKDVTRGELKPVWRTLPDVLARLPKVNGQQQRLPVFTTRNSANQYFQMANAAKGIVVDASYWFEDQLIEAYTKLPGVEVRLVHVDREDDPSVFRPLANDEETDVQHLAEVMAQVIRPGGAHLRTDVRRFQPSELPAIIRADAVTRGQSRAREILNDPDAPADLRELAEENLRLARREAMKLIINADNALIRRLARQNLSQADAVDVMLAVYNNAILVNQELMTPENAQIFHDHFQRLMARSLDFMEAQAGLQEEREVIRREHERSRRQVGPQPRHRIVFMMTPFSDDYEHLVSAVRSVVEDRWQCQLFVASDRQYDPTLLENVRLHMAQAHAFVAEVTDANPNVMFELGAAFADRAGRPVVLLRKNAGGNSHLPADLRGLLYVDYSKADAGELVDQLATEIGRSEEVATLINDPSRERYLSPRELRRRTRFSQIGEDIFQKLAERYPTEETWRNVQADDIRGYLGSEADLAATFCQRVVAGISF